MKQIQSISVYGGLFVVIAALAAITAQGELKAAAGCHSAYALASMSRVQAEACFRWDYD
jgi:hypothetical protein